MTTRIGLRDAKTATEAIGEALDLGKKITAIKIMRGMIYIAQNDGIFPENIPAATGDFGYISPPPFRGFYFSDLDCAQEVRKRAEIEDLVKTLRDKGVDVSAYYDGTIF